MRQALLKIPTIIAFSFLFICVAIILYFEYYTENKSSYLTFFAGLVASVFFARLLFLIPKEVFPVSFIAILIAIGGFYLSTTSLFHLGLMIVQGSVWFGLLRIGYSNESTI